jgi:hypothetical protein
MTIGEVAEDLEPKSLLQTSLDSKEQNSYRGGWGTCFQPLFSWAHSPDLHRQNKLY